MGSLGETLRRARQEKGLTLEQAEEATKIRDRLLIALEEEDYSVLPDRVYTKGLLKIYARFLGLDVGEVMRLWGEPEEVPAVQTALARALPMPLFSADMWVGVVIILGIALLAAWGFSQYVGPILAPTPTPTSTPLPTPTPVPTESAPSPTPAPGGVQIQLEAIARSWVEVRVDGELRFQGLMEAGEMQVWGGRELIALRLGNAAGVLLLFNETETGPWGATGEVADLECTPSGCLQLGAELAPTP